jgi:hypothetical protein
VRFGAFSLTLLAVTSITLAAARAYAEPSPHAQPYSFQLGAVWVEPIASTHRRFTSGFGLTLGATLRPLRVLGVQLGYMISRFGLRSDLLPGAALDGDQLTQSWSIHAVTWPIRLGRAEIYLLAGPALQLRLVDIASVRGSGVAPICDAWLLLCRPGVTSVEQLPGSRSAVEFALHAGLGVDVALDARTRLYLEVRYEFVWGAQLRSPADTTSQHGLDYLPSQADQEYLPIVFGVDF